MVEPTNHPARDEWERMLSGELYVADSPQQQEANMRKRRLVQAINTSEYDAFKERDELFHELFGAFGEGGFVEPPFNCDYGCNTFIGKNFYANMDCIFLDVARITIGDRVNIQDGSVLHTLYQKSVIEIGNDVSVGHNVTIHGAKVCDYALIGMGSVLLDGVEVGEGAIVAAGSVVSPGTKIGAHELWMGVPAKFKKMVDPAQAKEMNVKIAHNYLMYSKWYEEGK